MTVGDPSSWDDLFPEDMLSVLFSYVIETWYSMPVPNEFEQEDTITVRLYSFLKNGKDRNRHPFLIRYQDVEVDTELKKESGKKDLVFFPSFMEEIYFCLEAKRLNALVSGKRRALAHEYVTKGMQRFVNGQYSSAVRHCGMLGYVMDGNTERAISNVEANIVNRKQELRLENGDGFVASRIRETDELAKETGHRRSTGDSRFRMHHLFLACASSGASSA